MKKYILFLFYLLFPGSLMFAQSPQHTFVLGDSAFLLDGKPLQMISGEIHYPRVPREAWRSRMKMAKAMGLNTIGTYVFWNVHEPQEGHYEFTGNNDVAEFVKIAQEEGLWVVLRPSPYVCAEWEFGGYPYWLQNIPGLVVRSKEPQYFEAYKKYIMEVGKQLARYQVNHGGNILMVQIENEYGSYSNDKEYLDMNREIFKDAGFDGILFTCDPAKDVKNGYLAGLMPAINGLDKPGEMKNLVREFHDGKGPFYIAEWYPAWFDWWGTAHHTVPASKYATQLDRVLAAGISINMYMFHGGTTRGFMNGANCNQENPFEPQISSYDYDAPLDEAGNATEKFMQFREVIQKYLPKGKVLPDVPQTRKAIDTQPVKFTSQQSLFHLLPAPVTNEKPLTFEALNQDYGFVLYRTTVKGGEKGLLKINQLRDYGLIFANGSKVGVLDRRYKQDSLYITLPKGNVVLDILVENLGRINFGPFLLDNKKGITQSVMFNGKELKGWQMFSLPFNNTAGFTPRGMQKISEDQPVIRKGVFNISEIGDTYLDMQNWGKGCVWVNGHHLGRYWSVGPQQTIYVPAEWLKKGDNEVIVFELNKPGPTVLKGISKPILDQLTAK